MERYKGDYLHASLDILFNIIFYIINTMKKQTLLYHVRAYDTKKVLIWTCPPLPPSPLFVAMPLKQ